jgi:hypothetical protein
MGTLRDMTQSHLDLTEAIWGADGGRVFGVDLLMMAALQRSLGLIDGFCVMVERGNYICAVPLLRMQIDSAMRLYASLLVSNPDSVLIQLLNDRPLNRIKDRDGKSLTDAYLHAKLSKRVPWVSAVYGATSGFVHMSGRHLIFAVDSVGAADDRSYAFRIGAGGRQWTESEMIEALDAFIEATRVVFEIGRDWLATKRDGERQRAERDRRASTPDAESPP